MPPWSADSYLGAAEAIAKIIVVESKMRSACRSVLSEQLAGWHRIFALSLPSIVRGENQGLKKKSRGDPEGSVPCLPLSD